MRRGVIPVSSQDEVLLLKIAQTVPALQPLSLRLQSSTSNGTLELSQDEAEYLLDAWPTPALSATVPDSNAIAQAALRNRLTALFSQAKRP